MPLAPTPETPGLSSTELAEFYAGEGPHYFAVALHRLTGIPLVEVGKYNEIGELIGGTYAGKLPDGNLVDADGIWQPQALLDNWGCRVIQDTSEADILAILNNGDEPASEVFIGAFEREVAEVDGLLRGADKAFLERVVSALGFQKVTIADLCEGDLVDLAGDLFADPRGDNAAFEAEYGEVSFTRREMDACVVVGIEGVDWFGFPPGHEVEVRLPRPEPEADSAPAGP